MTDISQPRASAAHDLPLFGWIIRMLSRDGDARIWAVFLAVIALVVLAVVSFGVKALGLIALACVPVIFLVLLTITVGK